MADPASIARKRALAAARQRRYQARRRNDSILLSVERQRFSFVEALVEAGRLPQWSEDDREAINEAVDTLLADWEVHMTREGLDPLASAIIRRRY